MSGDSATSIGRRKFAYTALCLGLLAGAIPIGWLTGAGGPTGGPWIHTLLETVATLLACTVGAIALLRYYARKSLSYLLLGTGFLGAGILNGFHTVVTSPSCGHCTPSALPYLIPWSGVISGLFLSLLMLAGVMLGGMLTSRLERSQSAGRGINERKVYLIVGAGVLASGAICLFVPLPTAYSPQSLIHRPVDFAAGLIFAVAALGYLWKGAWKTSTFEHCLILFLICSAIQYSVYTPFSSEFFDAQSWAAHALKILAYLLVLAGLLSSTLSAFRATEESLADQKRMIESLAVESTHWQRVEKELRETRRELESRVAASAVELAEQDQLAGLASRVAAMLTQHDTVEETLAWCAEIIVRSLDAAFVRIWTLNKEQNILELRASAGIYTHLDGPHSRLPVGQCQIGRIAQEAKPYLTNSILDDSLSGSWLGDAAWARREAMVAFAGYPVMIEDQVEGVIAVFARRPLPEAATQVLGSLAGGLALFIGRKRVEAALMDSEERVRLLLDFAAEAICGVDTQGACTLVNRAGLALLGFNRPEDLLGREMHSTLHHSHADGSPYPAADCPMQIAFASGLGSHADNEVFWRADGTSFPVEYWSHPVIKAGKIVGSVVTFVDISARKRAEEEQRKLASLVENSDDFICIASPAGKVLYLNGAGAGMIGLENPQQILGHHISELHPDSAWAILEKGVQALTETGHQQEETQLRHWETGALIDVLLSAFLLRKPDTGEILCLAAIMRNITRRKRAEQALRASEERFRIAAENASDMTFEWDLATGEVQVFGANADRFGDRPAPRSFEAWKSLVHPDDLAPLLAELGRYIESGERFVGEYRVLGGNGRVYHYSLRGQAIRNPAGEPCKWIGLASDITEDTRTEEAIAQLAAIVQSSEDAIIGADLSGIMTTWNGGAEKLLGYTPAEALGAPISIVLPQGDRAGDILDPSINGHVSRFDQTLVRLKSRETLPVSLTLSPIRNPTGEVTGVAAIARDISARVRAEKDLAHQARHDHLTGLGNRLLLADRLDASIARAALSGRKTAVIYLDLDGFKLVNDTLGHEAGDDLLKQVTDRLEAGIREPDTLARMGGDEFMLVINEVPDSQTALTVANRLAAALRKPLSVAGHQLCVTASMGIGIYPEDGIDVSTLRRNADAAMYQAKRAGKDQILFFTPAMRATFLERFELEADLRQALERGDLALHYQPIFEAAQCRQTAFEALARWFHPTRGYIPPGKFIPVAEETGLISKLGAWALKQACFDCRNWQRQGLDSIRVAANVSALEFAGASFVEGVLALLDETGLRGDLLELELTETTLMRDLDASVLKMSALRKRGVRISIDDFGTGYSSLGYLARLPIDTLKIDRSFVAELSVNSTALSLIEGMITLAHNIGKRVIVEGVETDWQLTTLRDLGCDEVQGFLLGRPAALPNFSATPSRQEDQMEELEPAPL
jgi:diguanylate cyclase (GGDEF)-like protein/PAS domain S-box-containing protein